jgi:hypothetical protein
VRDIGVLAVSLNKRACRNARRRVTGGITPEAVDIASYEKKDVHERFTE